MKLAMNTRPFLLIAILALTGLLSGCFGPSDADIEAAIIEKHGGLSMKVYKLVDYHVTNSYSEDFGGGTVYIYEYTGNVAAANDGVTKSGFKANDTISGTVSLMKRGDKWYSN